MDANKRGDPCHKRNLRARWDGKVEEGVYRAETQRERDGGDAFLDTADSSIRQQYRTAFWALKYTHISYKPDAYMDSGLPFDISGVFAKEGSALAVGGGMVRVGSSRIWGERMYRAEPQRKRDDGNSFFDTIDSSVRQQYRPAYGAIRYTRSTYKLATYMNSGLSFDPF